MVQHLHCIGERSIDGNLHDCKFLACIKGGHKYDIDSP